MASISLSPIGLLAAAALAVILALGEVCNKKVVEGQQVVAAVFWIRVFAVLGFTVLLLVFLLRGSPPLIHAAAALTPEDLQNIPALAEQLRNPVSPAAKKIAGKLLESTRHQLANYKSGADDAELAKSLSADLNSDRVIEGDLLYQPNDFAGVMLSAETTRILGMGPHGEGRSYANRLLLEDLFPGAIEKTRKTALFGMKGVMVPPQVAFGAYLLIEVMLVAASQSLTTLALKVSPLSLCIPFSSFTPIFLLGTGYVVLRELPTGIEMLGIGLIVLGGVLMHRKSFAVSWNAPLRAIFKERGSRYVLLATMIASVYGPIEKQLILMSDPLTTAFAYGLGTVIAFGILCWSFRIDIKQVMRQRPGWAVLSGLSDASTMVAQFIAVMYLPVVIAICIKRAGIVLTVLAGWLVFRERDITDRLIAAFAMMGGIAIFYLPLQPSQIMILTGVVLAVVALALYLTRRMVRGSTLAEEPLEASAPR
jgi:drug/metabolite transporter (DMT)-like permease